MGGFSILILIVYLAIDIWFAIIVNEIAMDKGYESLFILCLLFGIIAYIYVATLPDLQLRQTNQEILRKLERLETENNQPPKPKYSLTKDRWVCRSCSEPNPNSIRICRSCGMDK